MSGMGRRTSNLGPATGPLDVPFVEFALCKARPSTVVTVLLRPRRVRGGAEVSIVVERAATGGCVEGSESSSRSDRSELERRSACSSGVCQCACRSPSCSCSVTWALASEGCGLIEADFEEEASTDGRGALNSPNACCSSGDVGDRMRPSSLFEKEAAWCARRMAVIRFLSPR